MRILREFVPHLVVFAISMIFVVPLSIAVAGDNVLQPDVSITEELQEIDGTVADPIAGFFNWFGEGIILLPLSAVIAIVLAFAGRYRDGLFIILPVAMAQLLDYGLKNLVASPRPSPEYVVVTESHSSFGFPSGHTLVTFVFVGALTHLFFRYSWSWKKRGIALGLAGMIVLLMGFSRIYVGAHWPSDILGAYLWGAGFVAIVLVVHRLILLDPHES